MIQLSLPYMAAGKTLTIYTFGDKMIALLFNILSRFVIAFLPRSMHLLISWLKSPSTVILEPRKIKSLTASTISPFICHDVMRPVTMILVFFNVDFQASFFTLLFHPYQKAFSSSSLIWGCWYFWQSWSQHVIHPAGLVLPFLALKYLMKLIFLPHNYCHFSY